MGWYVHSIGELPREAYRSYYVYLLDYGWDETFGEAVRSNLPRMADAASRSDAVVIHGPRGMHFEDEVLSWHDINGSPADDILPAILVTTGHPRTFREVFGPSARFRAPADALLLIPLRKTCKTPDDVVTLIDRLFRDVAGKKGTLRLCGGQGNAPGRRLRDRGCPHSATKSGRNRDRSCQARAVFQGRPRSMTFTSPLGQSGNRAKLT